MRRAGELIVKTAGDLLQRHRSLRLLVSLLVIITGIYAVGLIWSVLTLFGDVILLFFLAWIISFILEPASLFLQSRGLPRALAVTMIYLALLIVIVSAVVLTVPIIAQQVLLLTDEVGRTVSPQNMSSLNAALVALLERIGLAPANAHGVASQLSSQIPVWAASVQQQAMGAATGMVTSVLEILFSVVLIATISFYMMLDGGRLVESVVVRLPRPWLRDVRLFQDNVRRIFGGFFRAQLIIAALYGIITWVLLAVLGAPYGLLVALFSGLIMLLPFIGPFLAIVPPVVLMLLESPPDQVVVKVLALLIGLVVAQQIVFKGLAPRIFGDSMGVHPLLLFAALLIGAKFGGAWGAFFAAPIAALGCAMLDVFYTRFTKESPMFQSDDEEEVDEPVGEESVAEVVIPDPGASSHRLRLPFGTVGAGYPVASRADPGDSSSHASRPHASYPRASHLRGLEPLPETNHETNHETRHEVRHEPRGELRLERRTSGDPDFQ
jgi:predicted PurR-regulated permease PerM